MFLVVGLPKWGEMLGEGRLYSEVRAAVWWVWFWRRSVHALELWGWGLWVMWCVRGCGWEERGPPGRESKGMAGGTEI